MRPAPQDERGNPSNSFSDRLVVGLLTAAVLAVVLVQLWRWLEIVAGPLASIAAAIADEFVFRAALPLRPRSCCRPSRHPRRPPPRSQQPHYCRPRGRCYDHAPNPYDGHFDSH
ncbi:hypothetical protein DFJ73DRAFT_558995 [Zopfochytrium polystomum]|nr:hypothetical protein DFJ73DRAFT_558995 [Zopfochytrium polystomum]